MGTGYDFSVMFNEAHKAAVLAGEAVNASLPPEAARGFDCGFAWVTVRPARGPFVNWCKAMATLGGASVGGARAYGSRAYDGGWQFWKPGHIGTQSITVHEAAARAFAAVLVANGIAAEVGSRLD